MKARYIVGMFLLLCGLTQEARSERIHVSEWQKGEGCIQGFKRLGFDLTVQDCISLANEYGYPVYIYLPRPLSGKPSTITIPVKEGDPFAVVREGGNTVYKLYAPPKKKPLK